MNQKICSFLCIVFLGFLIYWNTVENSFHFDDVDYIVRNHHIQDLSNVKAIWQTNSMPFRFVTFYTFALNYHFHQLDGFGYHFVNICIHIINGLLVWALIGRVLITPRMAQTRLFEHKNIIALFGALIFIAHPLQTQAVTYLSQRFASLATLFYLLSLCFYMYARTTKEKQFHLILFFGSAVAALLGMFSKEIVVTLPLMIILFEVCFLSTGSLREAIQRKWKWFVGILSCALIIPAAHRFDFSWIFAVEVPSDSHLGDVLNWQSYLLTQFRVIMTYFKLVFFPVGQNLDYDFPASYSLFEPNVFLSFMVILAIIVLGFVLRSRFIMISVGIAWMFITLALESSVIVIQHVIFEHRMYLPFVGICFVCAASFFYLLPNKKSYVTVMSVVVIVLSFLTVQRNAVWRTEKTLWQDVVKKSPNKARGYLNLGLAYYVEGNKREAMTYFDQAIQLNPKYHRAYNNRAILFDQMGNIRKALADYQQALEIKPDYVEAYLNRGYLYGRQGRFEQAITDFDSAIEHNEQMIPAFWGRGITYKNIGRPTKALADFKKVLELEPGHNKAKQEISKLTP